MSHLKGLLVQNAAARVLTGISKRDHIAPTLACLWWAIQTEFKILLLESKSREKCLFLPNYLHVWAHYSKHKTGSFFVSSELFGFSLLTNSKEGNSGFGAAIRPFSVGTSSELPAETTGLTKGQRGGREFAWESLAWLLGGLTCRWARPWLTSAEHSEKV